jgi:hypothetical protein
MVPRTASAIEGTASRWRPAASIGAVFLPVAWTVFVVLALISFGMIAAYWLDVQDRRDLSIRRRIGYSLATVAFPLTIPIYALAGGAGWPRPLRIAAFVPPVALALFLAFLFGLIR